MDIRWLYTLFFSNPAFIFCLASSAYNVDYSWLILSLFIFWVSLDTVGLSCNLYSFINGVNTIENVFRGRNNQILIEISIDELRPLMPEKIAEGLYENTQYQRWVSGMRRFIGGDNNFKKNRFYIRKFKGPPFDYLVKSYVSFSGTSFVFLRDEITATSKPFQKFKFYHELAHITLYGMMALSVMNARVLKYIIFLILAILSVRMNNLIICGLALVFVVELIRRACAPIEFEAKADALAIFGIAKDDRQEVARLCRKLWQIEEKTASFENIYRWGSLKRNINKINKDDSKLPHGVYSNNYNGLVSAVVYALVIYAATNTSEISLLKAFLVGIILTVGQLIVHSFLYGRVVVVENAIRDYVSEYSIEVE